MPTYQQALPRGSTALADVGIDSARTETELLLAHACGITRTELKRRIVIGLTMDDAEAATFAKLIEKRANHIPLQHLIGTAPFRYLDLKVGPGVFIPRPETEVVAGYAINWLKNEQHKNDPAQPIAVDLCTGTGAIAIAIATECPGAKVYAVELNEPAYQWAAQNINTYAPEIKLINGDALTALPKLNGQVDLVISNPPYLAPHELPNQPEVHRHDPPMALYGQGPDGITVPTGVAQTAARLLKPGGLLVMEHGDHQAAALLAIVQQLPFTKVQSHRDLTNRDRFVTAIRA